MATRSVAEQKGIPYIFAAYCPITLPSVHHAPPPLMRGQTPTLAVADNRVLWDQDVQFWNDMWGAALNDLRKAAGLDPVTDVRGHIFTDRPLLAADPTLAPWPTPSELEVTQTGAWILPDDRPLSAELEAFLAAGEPPIFFGFGSMPAAPETSRMMSNVARAMGHRAIVSAGWADLSFVDEGPDCLSIAEVNQQALFPRVAAVVHHGGAGTTTTAVRAGAPQVVVPQTYDQHYWAQRIDHLGIGVAHPPTEPTTDSLTAALKDALHRDIAARAQSLAAAVRTDGTTAAAQHVTNRDR